MMYEKMSQNSITQNNSVKWHIKNATEFNYTK